MTVQGLSGLAAVCLVASAASADVIITEIMYNPDSYEGKIMDRNDPTSKDEPNLVEWVELYNTGAEAVDVSGWKLGDEDGTTSGLPDGTTIEPGEAVVLVPGQQTAAAFHEAWGDGYDVYPVDGWSSGGLVNLANGPSETNEILRLEDAQGLTKDQVNYDDEGDWPSDSPDGSSIFLIDTALDAEANDSGSNWRRSAIGAGESKANTQTDAYNGKDFGSPGVVTAAAGMEPEPY